jgi:hypothetical protein
MERLREKIDNYLNGELPAPEVVVFEASLRTDPELAAEVELQRRMQSVLSDTGEWELRQTLQSISEEHTRPQGQDPQAKQTTGHSTWWYLGPVLIVGLFALVYFFNPFSYSSVEDVDPPPPEIGKRTEQSDFPLELIVEDTLKLAPATDPTYAPDSTRPKPSRGSRDPMVPLPALEQILAAKASVVYDFELSANYMPGLLTLAGTLYTIDLPKDSTFLLRIFNNDPDRFPSRPVLAAELRPKEVVVQEETFAFGRKKTYLVSFSRELKLAKGRYYYLIYTDIEPDTVLTAGVVE